MPFDRTPTFMFGLPKMTFLDWNATTKDATQKKASDLRAYLEDQYTKRRPIDNTAEISKLHLSFDDTGVMAQFIGKNGQKGSECSITRHALQQIGAFIAPKGAKTSPFNISEAVTAWDDETRQICANLWRKMMKDNHKELLFRSKMINDVRTITSVQGKNYAVVKDYELFHKNVENYRVVAAQITSEYSHYRLVENKAKLETDPDVCYEVWNSDAGTKALSLELMAWVQICTNGMKGWSTATSFSTRHYGNTESILEGYQSQFTGNKLRFVSDYLDMRKIEFNVRDYLDTCLLDNSFAVEIEMALESKKIASPKGTLASLWDAMTLAAQKFPNRGDYEKLAATEIFQIKESNNS